MLQINNRRYIGSKTKLLEHILHAVDETVLPANYSVADVFAGTGVVAYEFAKRGHRTIVNDMLYSNVVAYNAWLSDAPYRADVVEQILRKFNELSYNQIEENYLSRIYGNKYFSVNDAKKIGYCRDFLESSRELLQPREYYIILTSLLYTADKIANTVGHFESFLNKTPEDSNFTMQQLTIEKVVPAEIFNQDANILAPQIEADVVYLDPPYNARQYVNFYHVLENIARWEKPEVFEGNSMKFQRNHLKSGYSRSVAPRLLQNLVDNLRCRQIIVSYNNTYDARSGASNNKIQEQEIFDILRTKGEVRKEEIDYKGFNAGKTDFKNHKEFLFICNVNQ